MTFLTFHANASGLFRHSIIIMDGFQTAAPAEPLSKFIFGNCLILKLFPSASMNEDPSRKIRMTIRLRQLQNPVLPDYEGEAENQDRSIRMLFEKLLDS